MKLLTLQTMLKQRTHRDLELIARAHGLPFTRLSLDILDKSEYF